VRAVAHLAVHLGGDDNLLAPAAALGEPATDDLFGDALAELPPVHVGGVEEIDAVFAGAVHDREAVRLRRDGTEVHGAQAEAADGQAGTAEVRVLHGLNLAREGYAPLRVLGCGSRPEKYVVPARAAFDRTIGHGSVGRCTPRA